MKKSKKGNKSIRGNGADAKANDRAKLLQTITEWGYMESVFKSQRQLLEGRRLLDIGMGGGPLSIAAIETAGCASYVGVDPLVGSNTVRNPRAELDPNQPRYTSFPFSPDDIMRIYPNIKLYANTLENVQDEVRKHSVDMAYLASVTEHLQDLPTVFKTIWETLEPGGRLWFSHHGYHSWTGHHHYPRSVDSWDRNNETQNAVVDWKHLETDHPSYSNPNFNRVRLADFRTLIEKYFEIIDWQLICHAEERLTPQIRERFKKYTLEELLGRTVHVLAIRRDKPLYTDISKIPFFHPPEDYLAKADHSKDRLPETAVQGACYFWNPQGIASHSTNDFRAANVFADLNAGDQLRIRKYFDVMDFTIEEVRKPEGGSISIIVKDPISDALFESSRSDWTVSAVRKNEKGRLLDWQLV